MTETEKEEQALRARVMLLRGRTASEDGTELALSWEDLGALANVSKSTFAMVVDRGRISLETARGLARVTGAKVGWITAGEGKAPSRDAVRAAIKAAQAAQAKGAA